MADLQKLKVVFLFALIVNALLLFNFSEIIAENALIYINEENKIIYPAQVLNLTNWKIQLPIDLNGDGKADEVKQPKLREYMHTLYFYVGANGSSVIFRAPTQGATTPNSQYPRCELREMNGTINAAWDSSVGKHILSVTLRVNELPAIKPVVCVAQIHDGTGAVYMIKVNRNLVYVDNKINAKYEGSLELDKSYTLGKIFSLEIVVYNDKTEVYYNGLLKCVLRAKFSNAYFKTGCYVQSNETPVSYAEVEIFDLKLYHLAYHGQAEESESSSSTKNIFPVMAAGVCGLMLFSGLIAYWALLKRREKKETD